MASAGRVPAGCRRSPADLPAVHGRAEQTSSVAATVTLDRPRSGEERVSNLYCLAPGLSPVDSDKAHAPKRRSRRPPHGGADYEDAVKKTGAGFQTWPVVTQPAPSVSAVSGCGYRTDSGPLKPPSAGGGGDGRDSIVCSECGRCRCEACRSRRPLPQRLLCGRTCLLSAANLVDCLSCLCLVKAAAYHCAVAPDSSWRAVDRPCACRPRGAGCCGRWAALALLTPLLPCLLCYWPLRGAASLAETCYQRGRDVGCTCPPAVDADGDREPAALSRRGDDARTRAKAGWACADGSSLRA